MALKRSDLLISDCKNIYLINATFRDNGYIRAGALLCVETRQPVATFTLPEESFRLLIPEQCLDPTSITKTFNLDLPILDQNG
jgi:hypothetical protein